MLTVIKTSRADCMNSTQQLSLHNSLISVDFTQKRKKKLIWHSKVKKSEVRLYYSAL